MWDESSELQLLFDAMYSTPRYGKQHKSWYILYQMPQILNEQKYWI